MRFVELRVNDGFESSTVPVKAKSDPTSVAVTVPSWLETLRAVGGSFPTMSATPLQTLLSGFGVPGVEVPPMFHRPLTVKLSPLPPPQARPPNISAVRKTPL
jgi:hypothetical protein